LPILTVVAVGRMVGVAGGGGSSSSSGGLVPIGGCVC